MPPPIPSSVRVVRLYTGDQMLSTRGITPTAGLRWPAKHPLDDELPWWIDATGWLTDPHGRVWDTIGQIAYPTTLSDSALSITGTVISADGLQAGIYFAGGTPGQSSLLTFVLTGAATGEQKGVSVTLPILPVPPLPPNPSTDATLHKSLVTIGGFPYPISGT